jgi:cytochrome b pre-mRNA-processing protein 3
MGASLTAMRASMQLHVRRGWGLRLELPLNEPSEEPRMSFLSRLFGTGRDPKEDLRPLWHRTVEIAREPHWYAECGVADTVEGRFDMITAVLAVVLVRMEREEELVAPSVFLTELFVDDMDGQLREAGVGDLVVGKRMGRLMSTMGGRLGAYRTGLASDDTALAQAVERNVTLGDGGSADCVARNMRALAARLDTTTAEALVAGEFAA